MTVGVTAGSWLRRHRMTLFTIAVIAFYALFVEFFWGWSTILEAWRAVGMGSVITALLLLIATYVVRTHRMQDYFGGNTVGQFLRLFRVTQIHNLLNIMLPFRAGETSFPLLMRSEFSIPLAHGTAALLVLRLLDLHALLAAGGLGLVIASDDRMLAVIAWCVFLVLPLSFLPFRTRMFSMLHRRMSGRFADIIDEIDDGIPRDLRAFMRAWALTVVNWGVKVLVLAWVLGLMGVAPIAACFGGALGGELSSVLPVHAPGGVGTYPAGIAAGAAAFGAARAAAALSVIAVASINAHLMIVVSAVLGTGLSLVLPLLVSPGRRRTY